jgi:2-iminoacetate synthase
MMTVNNEYIHGLLDNARGGPSPADISAVLDKIDKMAGLRHDEVASLLMCGCDEVWRRVYDAAGRIKREIYGDRVVLFAPLYVSDYCVNNCLYCGFRAKDGGARKRLSMDGLRREVEILSRMGHKRLALEAGEDSYNCSIEYILECIDTIYNTKVDGAGIRRINVNIAATTVENYAKLKKANIGTYILFQETYHRKTYGHYHPGGPKADFDYHLTAFDRANAAGIDDVGAGVLFGLYDYRFEVLALLLHNEHLETAYGAGFHTISVPRVCGGGDEGLAFPYAVSDEEMKRIVAVLRVAVPYTGIIISTRETAEMRKSLINIGVSQISGGSKVEVGGYSDETDAGRQFDVADNRKASEIIYWLMEEGLIPSFCTACYRKERTGDRFMRLAKTGAIKGVCLPNALLTLKEYALDYGDERFAALAEKVIGKHLSEIADITIREKIAADLIKLENGERDLFI